MEHYTLKELTCYFLRLGATGWGGPVALVGYMHRDLVESREWIEEEDFKEGLALAQLAPGPLAAQLAIYLGFVHHRIIGATIAGIAFVLPSFLIVLVLGATYVSYGGLTWMQGVFYGVGASVIGIIAMSAYRLCVKNLGSDRWHWLIFGVMAATTYATESEIVWLVIASGGLMWMIKAPPQFLHRVSLVSAPMFAQITSLSSESLLVQIALFFGSAGSFVFGSGLAIIPFLYGGVVRDFGWLNEQQFVDAVAVAMITPGPVVITTGFIGFLVAGFPGACVAAFATFLPCYLFTILPAPYFKKYGKHPGVKAFVDGVTAAAIGAIVGAVFVLGRRTLTDVPTTLIALSTAVVLLKPGRIREPYIIVCAAIIGMILRTAT